MVGLSSEEKNRYMTPRSRFASVISSQLHCQHSGSNPRRSETSAPTSRLVMETRPWTDLKSPGFLALATLAPIISTTMPFSSRAMFCTASSSATFCWHSMWVIRDSLRKASSSRVSSSDNSKFDDWSIPGKVCEALPAASSLDSFRLRTTRAIFLLLASILLKRRTTMRSMIMLMIALTRHMTMITNKHVRISEMASILFGCSKLK
mmetsp:Transcript_84697/g.258596  ORF Transcript_84697/g.258596 Transcript_84697/m.258596 type:complete len:206 (-) Transcript_84697:1287-1904(-)